MSSLLFFGDYTKSGVGTAPSVAPTIAIYSVNRSTGAEASVVSGGVVTASALVGRYYYDLASANLQTYDYHARFHTTDTTVDAQDIAALWTRWSEAVATDANGGVTVGGYESGEDPATLIAAAGYTTARAGYLDTLNLARAIVARNLDAVTAPTLDDCLTAAFASLSDAGTETSTTLVTQLPNRSGPLRSLSVTRDSNGNVTAWS